MPAKKPPVPSPSGPRYRVAAVMIVRDEEVNVPHSIGSVRGWADRVWVVDSGSTDRTVEVARSLGAERQSDLMPLLAPPLPKQPYSVSSYPSALGDSVGWLSSVGDVA